MPHSPNMTTLPTVKELFDWVRDNHSDKVLSQVQVDAVDTLLTAMPIQMVQDTISKLNGWDINTTQALPNIPKPPIPPKLSKLDIITAAEGLGIEPAALKAVIDIEARASGFDSKGRPTILFERHKMWKHLTDINYFTWRNKLAAEYPDVCNKSAGAYNVRSQYEKLAIAEAVNWDAAHMSCSFGLGQIMAFHWELLGYGSVKEFVDAMYKSEAEQLDAMCRFIRINNLAKPLQRKDWAAFARGYNGVAYRINKYDVKLAAAYVKAKVDGW